MTKGTVDVVWRGLDAPAVTRLSQQVDQSPNQETVNGFTQNVLGGARVLQLEWSPTSPMRSNKALRQAIAVALQGDRTSDSIVPTGVDGHTVCIPAGRQGQAESDLEEPHQPHARLRRLHAQRPGHRDPDPHPVGEHRRAERAAQAGSDGCGPEPCGPEGLDGDSPGMAAAISRCAAADRRIDGQDDRNRVSRHHGWWYGESASWPRCRSRRPWI